jgi:hypothetical protein
MRGIELRAAAVRSIDICITSLGLWPGNALLAPFVTPFLLSLFSGPINIIGHSSGLPATSRHVSLILKHTFLCVSYLSVTSPACPAYQLEQCERARKAFSLHSDCMKLNCSVPISRNMGTCHITWNIDPARVKTRYVKFFLPWKYLIYFKVN